MKTRGLPSSNDRRFHNIQEVHKKAQRVSTNQLRAVFLVFRLNTDMHDVMMIKQFCKDSLLRKAFL